MKYSYLIYSLLLLVLLTNCKKEQMQVYNSRHYVQFTEPVMDTINFSFFFYPGQTEVDMPMAVKLVGLMPEGNLSYQIKVDGSVSNALTKNYSMPESFEFQKGQATDSAYITIRNSPELKQQTYLLALEISSSDNVTAGQTTHIRKVIRINDMVSKPSWWDWKMDSFYLGVYTEKKFRKFMEVTGVGDLSKLSQALQREYILQFKYYLIQMKDAGTPVLEEDGTDMLSTIRIVG